MRCVDLVVGALAGVVLCAPALAQPAAEADLLERIRIEIGDARCSRHEQCRTLAVGAKACGGAAAWWPWSTANTDGERLQAWSRELDAMQRRRFAREGLMSDCRFLPDPGATCVAGRCVLRSGALE